VSVAANETAEVDFTLEKGVSVSGRIMDGDEPVEGVYVNLSRVEEGEEFHAAVKSKEGGKYRIEGVPFGRYEVMVGGRRGTERFSCPLAEPLVVSGAVEGYDITLPSGRISGTVTDAQGKPLENVYVRLGRDTQGKEERPMMSWERGLMEHLMSKKTDDSGGFEFSAIGRGTYSLVASKTGLGQATQAIVMDSNDGEENVVVTLKPGRSLKIKINGEDRNETIERALVRVTGRGGSRLKEEVMAVDGGVLTIDDLSEGVYRIEVAAEGYAPGLLESVEVGPETKEPVVLTVVKGGTIKVAAVDDKGAPLKAGFVEILNPEGRSLSYLCFSRFEAGGKIVTDSRGRAVLDGIPAGDVVVRVGAKGYVPADAKATVKKGETKELNVTVKKKKAVETKERSEKSAGDRVQGRAMPAGEKQPIR
jgi:hypothetical protein